jgi:lincosamide nucleotidyltransferase
VLVQERLIARVREVCAADDQLDAALMYGSFAAGEADAYSDVEFWLFFEPQWRGQVDARACAAPRARARPGCRRYLWSSRGSARPAAR